MFLIKIYNMKGKKHLQYQFCFPRQKITWKLKSITLAPDGEMTCKIALKAKGQGEAIGWPNYTHILRAIT